MNQEKGRRPEGVGERFALEGVEYVLGKQVAFGRTSEVFAASDTWGNRLVAKRYLPDASRAMADNELNCLARFRHEGIVSLHAAFRRPSGTYLMLRDSGLPLTRFNFGATKERACQIVAASLLQALHHIHSQGFTHGDINPQNVLVAVNGPGGSPVVRICDFALCGKTGTAPLAFCHWCPAPEQQGNQSPRAPAGDIFQAAAVLLNILCGSWEDWPGETPPLESARSLDTPLGHVLAGALSPIPAERPSAVDLWKQVHAARPHEEPASV